eukprot:8849829-Karenia_brevis.AAC.1
MLPKWEGYARLPPFDLSPCNPRRAMLDSMVVVESSTPAGSRASHSGSVLFGRPDSLSVSGRGGGRTDG